MHLRKIAGAHQGKISGLCWADENRMLSCGVDRNIKMWDVRPGTTSEYSEAGPSQASFPFCTSSDLPTFFLAKTSGSFSRQGNAPVSPHALIVLLLLMQSLSFSSIDHHSKDPLFATSSTIVQVWDKTKYVGYPDIFPFSLPSGVPP